MPKLSEIRPDPEREKGVRVHIGAGAVLRIASAYTAARDLAMVQALEPHRLRIRQGSMPFSERRDIEDRVDAEHLLVGWEDLLDEDGSPIPYSIDKSFEFLNAAKHHWLRKIVVEVAFERDYFRLAVREDSLGNSQGASSGESSGGTKSNSSADSPKPDKT